jgi:hypothetical protein
LFKFLGLTRADGGDTSSKNAYIVGERGPELFVPKTDGTIVPNEKLNFKGFRAGGGDVTASDFSSSILAGLGISANKDNTAALQQWMRFEGGHFKNSAKYNPLNTTLDMPGSHAMNKAGVEAYTSFDQGIQATIKTLTGKNADARGYTGIVEALRSGSKEDILAAIDNSAWRTGKTGGSGAYKWGGGSSSTPSGGSVSNSAGTVSSGGTLAQQMAAQTGFRSDSKMGGSNTTFAAGSVVITINGAKDPKAVGQAVKDALVSEVAKK